MSVTKNGAPTDAAKAGNGAPTEKITVPTLAGQAMDKRLDTHER